MEFKDAINRIRPSLENDPNLIKHYGVVVKVLKLLYKDENVEEAFRLELSNEEIIDYAKKAILDLLGKQMTAEDILQVEIVSPKKLLCIRADSHFYPEEIFSLIDSEFVIRERIKFFTGFDVDINLL